MSGARGFSRRTALLAIAAGMAAFPGRARAAVRSRTAPAKPWLVCYAEDLPIPAFDGYGLAVLDSKHHPPLRMLKDRGLTLLGYLSLGEVEDHRSWFEPVRQDGLLIEENKVWHGSWSVDTRDPRWTARVVEDLVPRILQAGFDGLFFDTLDNPIELEERDPVRFGGMIEGAARLVRAIRLNFPTAPIMMNRGYALLPAVESAIDMILGESVYTTFDFATKAYRRVSPSDYAWQADQLRAAKARRPALRTMTLDYWDPMDVETIAEIYAFEEAQGFEPYVATIELDRIVPRPPR